MPGNQNEAAFTTSRGGYPPRYNDTIEPRRRARRRRRRRKVLVRALVLKEPVRRERQRVCARDTRTCVRVGVRARLSKISPRFLVVPTTTTTMTFGDCEDFSRRGASPRPPAVLATRSTRAKSPRRSSACHCSGNNGNPERRLPRNVRREI